jgi:hypothetical protein
MLDGAAPRVVWYGGVATAFLFVTRRSSTYEILVAGEGDRR